MRFFWRSFFLIFIIALYIPCLAAAGDAPSDDIKQAANEGVRDFVKNNGLGGLRHLGFTRQAEIDSADLSEGFKIYTIRPDKLLNESDLLDSKSLVTPTDQWQFLVVGGTDACVLLTVDLVNGKWTPVSIGSSALAKELSEILKAWPTSSGYQYRFIRVYQAKSDFIELSQRGEVLGVIPLTSLVVAISGEGISAFNSRDLRNPKEVFPNLRPLVERNLNEK